MRMVNGYVGTAGLLAPGRGLRRAGHRHAGAADGQARPARPPLDGHHRQTACGHRRRGHLPEERQRGRRRVRHDRRHLDDVGHARVGRRDPGPHLQPEDEEGDWRQRARRGAHRRHARVLQVEEARVPARLRAARGGDARHARRHPRDAGRVRDHEPQGRARAGDPDGRRLPDRATGHGLHRAREGAHQGVALLQGGVPDPPRRGARGAGGRRDLQAAGPRGHAAQARRDRAAGAQGRQVAQGRHHGGLRPLLQGRHRAGDRPQHAGAGRPHHHGRPGRLEGPPRRARDDDLQGHRGLQAHHVGAGAGDAAGAQHPGEHRRESDGLQQPALHARDLPGDEHGLRRPRLLLRRPVRAAGRAHQGPALEGVREGALRRHRLGQERPRREAGRSLPLPGGEEPVRGAARGVDVEEGPQGRGAPRTTSAPTTRASTPGRRQCRRPTKRGGSCR